MAELSLAELIRVNDAAERFETGWRKGERPRIELFLHGLPPVLRDEILRTLLEIEIEIRKGTRAPATRKEFELRFPAQRPIVAAAFGDNRQS
jgi:eukaryotic-like serine/threonine-protein kinase